MPILGIMASAILKKITDLFNRTTSGSLGNANTGQTWQATRGVWYANGTQATSTDAASGYPLASIPFNAKTTVSATVSEGTGVAYWTTDASNWYATIAYHTQSTYSCGCSTCCNTCSHTGGSCGTTTNCNTCTHTGGSCGSTYSCDYLGNPNAYVSGTGCYEIEGGNAVYLAAAQSIPITCTNQDCTACGSTISNVTCTNSDCAACGSYSCGCSTCTNDYYWMRMLKSVSGTVSTVISDYSLASLPAAIKVITNGGTITEYAYSDTAMTSLLGSTSATPASPVIGNKVGIIKAPAAITQGTTVDNFSAQ